MSDLRQMVVSASRGLLLVGTVVLDTPYCAYGSRVRKGQARFAVRGDAAVSQRRPVARVAMPTFWDGVAQAFDIRAQHPPCNVVGDKSLNLYVAVVQDWIRYSERGGRAAAQHLQGVNE